jgi:hypothetical protein
MARIFAIFRVRGWFNRARRTALKGRRLSGIGNRRVGTALRDFQFANGVALLKEPYNR